MKVWPKSEACEIPVNAKKLQTKTVCGRKKCEQEEKDNECLREQSSIDLKNLLEEN